MRIGTAELRVERICRRCLTPTFGADTQEQDPGLLRRIKKELEAGFALKCTVTEPGDIAVGDPVEPS